MQICTAAIKGISVYSASAEVTLPKKDGEKPGDYDARTWRHKAHVDQDGVVVIPFMAFKKALAAAAKLTPRKIGGRGNQTYGAQFQSGVLITESLRLGIKREDLRSETFSCSATGDSRGVGKRVPRIFPMVDNWGGVMTFYVTNPTIDQKIFETYLRESGQFVGVGRFRPENGGVNGRFTVESVKWSEAA